MRVDFVPVEINIKDNFRYGQVAVILDNPKVYKKIIKLRKEWKIEKVYPYKQYLLWVKKLGNLGLDKKFRIEVNKLCRLLQLDFAFERVLKMAIVCNEVGDRDFKTAYWEPVFDPRNPTGSTKRYAIYLTPDTLQKEIIDVYKEFIEEVNYSRSPNEHYDFKFIPSISKRYLTDTKGEITTHREWYWKNRNGKTPRQIAKEIAEHSNIDIDSYIARIKVAIKSYKNTLTGSFGKS